MIAPLLQEQARWLESLGDNCEIGFVLDHVGNDEGGLFRWTRMPAASLLALLWAKFVGFYEYENLSPLTDDMVWESRFQIGWHTDMRSHTTADRREFNGSEPERRAIYRRELEKRLALVEKFQRRLRSGKLTFVIKDNDLIEPDLLDEIEGQLTMMAEGASFRLLHMRRARDGEAPGALSRLSERRWEGAVAFFAPYDQADQYDLASWLKVFGALVRP